MNALLVSRSLRGVLATMAMIAISSNVYAQESTFRDLIRKRIKNPTAEFTSLPGVDPQKVVALEYKVLHKVGKEENAVNPNTHQFKLGDQIRVRIEPLNDTFIYIFHEGASGERTCLLPTAEETPPAAKAGKVLELPEDGYFEFAAPPGDEKLIVVATEKPISDLAALSNVVFKKPDEELTPKEKEIKAKLQASGQKVLKSIRDRQAEQTTFRGILSDEALKKLSAQMASEGKTRAIIEEPPHDKETSSFAMAAAGKGGDRPDLYVSIPLKSIGK